MQNVQFLCIRMSAENWNLLLCLDTYISNRNIVWIKITRTPETLQHIYNKQLNRKTKKKLVIRKAEKHFLLWATFWVHPITDRLIYM